MSAIRRALAGLIAGIAIQPATRAASTQPQIECSEEEYKRLPESQGDVQASFHEYLQSRYAGPRIGLNEPFEWSGSVAKKTGNWRNFSTSGDKSRADLDQFIQDRTR